LTGCPEQRALLARPSCVFVEFLLVLARDAGKLWRHDDKGRRPDGLTC
jgi:hypothetical protein